LRHPTSRYLQSRLSVRGASGKAGLLDRPDIAVSFGPLSGKSGHEGR
jgi:hypothetical protein